LDDFLTIDPPKFNGHRTMVILTMVFKQLNIHLAARKTLGPTTSLDYLGELG